MSVRKAEMLKTINAANRKLQALRHENFIYSAEYKTALNAIQNLRGESPFKKKQFLTIPGSSKKTVKELKQSYQLAKQIKKNKNLSVRKIQKDIASKRMQTFGKKGITVKNQQVLFDILNSDEFKKIKELSFDSNQMLQIIKEKMKTANSSTDIISSLKKFLTDNRTDKQYFEDLQNLFQ